MKPFWAFVKKEWYHIFRDRRTLLILFGLPIVQVTLFGFAITNEIKNADIVVVNPSQDAMALEIETRLVASGYFRVAERLVHSNSLEDTFKKGKVRLAVVFPTSFGDKISHEQKVQIQLIADASDPNTATTLIGYASSIIQGYLLEWLNLEELPATIQPEVHMMYNRRLEGVYLFVPGVISMILMLVSAMLTSITLAREKELGTMEILLVSPLRPAVIVLGKVIPYIFLSFVNTLTIIGLARFVFGMPLNGSFILLLATCLLYIITSLSIGIFISTKADTQLVAMLVSMAGLLMPTVLLSGFIFPIDAMPLLLQVISNVLPAKWFIIIIKNVMIKGTSFMFIWKPVLVLCGITLVLLLISIKSFQTRLR